MVAAAYTPLILTGEAQLHIIFDDIHLKCESHRATIELEKFFHDQIRSEVGSLVRSLLFLDLHKEDYINDNLLSKYDQSSRIGEQ